MNDTNDDANAVHIPVCLSQSADGANGTNGRNAAPDEEASACHVLMNSRRYGTSAFACKNVGEASQTMAWLAVRAEEERKMDGVQRFFCLLPPLSQREETPDTIAHGPDTPESEDALVVCVAEGALQWIAADGLEERPLIVLEAVGSEAEGPFLCWQACARPLRQMSRLHRHAVSRYLHLRRLRQHDEPDSLAITEAEGESAMVDPVVCAWRQEQADETCPPLTLSAVVETCCADAPTDTPKEMTV